MRLIKDIVMQDPKESIGNWNNRDAWDVIGTRKLSTVKSDEICAKFNFAQNILMLYPIKLNWYNSRSLCRRFGGQLHIDDSEKSVLQRSFSLVEKGEKNNPNRCIRVWLGASDVEEEGIWRHSETNEVIDLSAFWGLGQPNGVRIQNCAGIWELVRRYVIPTKPLTCLTFLIPPDLLVINKFFVLRQDYFHDSALDWLSNTSADK